MPPGAVKRHRKSGSTPAAASGTFCVMPEWRNWQTRATQNLIRRLLTTHRSCSSTRFLYIHITVHCVHPVH